MAAANASVQSEMLPASIAKQVFRGGGGGRVGPDRPSSQSMDANVDMEAETDFSFSSQRCTCCPYGYHIDLDFLQYLDSMYSTKKLKTLKRFRRRGSPLLSPERSAFAGSHEYSRETENIVLISDGEAMSPTELLVETDISLLVGATTSASVVSGRDLRPKQENRLNLEPQTDTASCTVSGSLDAEVVRLKDSLICAVESINSDEHRALVGGVEHDAIDSPQTVKKSEVKLSLAATIGEPCNTRESGSQLLGDMSDADCGSVSPSVLQAIREQMMASLRRMKELEEQVKVIPVLQARISMLKEENRLLCVNADRTFCDVAVGDVPLDGVFQSSPRIVATQLDSTPAVLNGENGRQLNSADSTFPQSSDSFPVESRAVGVGESRNLSVTFACSSEIQTLEAGVNTEVVVEPGRESRSIGVLCKASTKDISVGRSTTFVDAGVGDQHVSGSSQDKFVQHLEDETTLSNFEYSEHSQSVSLRRDYIVSSHSEISESRRKGLDVTEAEMSSSEHSGRFRSIGVQCGDGVVPPGNGLMEKLEFPQDGTGDHTKPIMIDRGTETDRFSFPEHVLVSAERSESAVEDIPRRMNEVEIKTQSKSSLTGITHSLVSESQDVTNRRDTSLQELRGKPVSLDRNTIVEVPKQEFSIEVTSHSYSSTDDETRESTGKQLLDTEAVEGFVSEQTLESPRCGVPVIIDDSSESTSATASDSEDGSTLSVIEVTQRRGAGFQKAIRSVDEYFASENSDVQPLVDESLTGTGSSEVVTSASKFVVVESATLSMQNSSDLEEKYKDFTTQDNKEEFVKLCKNDVAASEVTAASSFVLGVPGTATVEDCSGKSAGQKNNHTEFISTVESEVAVTTSERVKSLERSPEWKAERVSTVGRDGAETCFLISSVGDDTGFSSPVTDHVEFFHTVKRKYETCIVDDGRIPTESNIPSPAEDSVSRPTSETQKPRDEILGSFPVSALTSCDREVTSHDLSATNGAELNSTATYRRIVITETKTERRRINEQNCDELNMPEMPPDTKSPADLNEDVVFQCESQSEKSSHGETETELKVLHSNQTTSGQAESESAQPEHIAASVASEDRKNERKTKEEEEEERECQTMLAAASDEHSPAVDTETVGAVIQSSSSAAGVCNIAPSTDKEEKFDSGIREALALYEQWILCPEGKDIDKMAMFDLVRRHWFLISGRKSSSAVEVKDFLSLAQTYSSQLLATVVNMADADGNTALHYAVSYGNTDVLRLLLDTGACDVNRQNKAGYTAVMLASLLLVDMDRYQSIIQRLFEAGDVNVPSTLSGQTALMLAASHGRNQMVMLLMECGANVNAQDEDGSTALMCASEHGHIDIIKTLLSHEECDSLLTDVDGSTALSVAMEEGYQEIGVLLYAHMKAMKGSTLEEDEEAEQD